VSGEDNNEYICLINEEEQYSIWYAGKKIPIGWKKIGPTGSKNDILDYINKVWTDMRPESLRVSMNKRL